MQEERGSAFHIEGAVKFQHGDVLKRGGKRGPEGRMG